MKLKQTTFGTSQIVQKYPPNHTHQIEINDQLVLLIAGNLLPLSLVDSQYFHNFTSSLDPQYQVPIRKFLITKLLENKI